MSTENNIFDAPVPDLEPTNIADLKAPQSVPSRLVLVSIDFSATSNALLKYAFDHLLRPKDTLVMLHVITHPLSPAAVEFYSGIDVTSIINQVKESAMQGMVNLVKEVKATHGKDLDVTIEARIVYGDAREAICRAAEKLHAAMLVVGSRGMGGLKSVLLGSVSSYCLQHSKVPVVVYREPDVPK